MSLLDKYAGCLLGGAVGDSLGAAVEFLTRDEIVARFGDRGIEAPAEVYGRVGAITDDTQMTLFTAEGLIQADDRLEHGTGYPPSNVWFAYQRWLRTQGVNPVWRGEAAQLQHGELWRVGALHSRRAPGATCLQALSDDFEFEAGAPGARFRTDSGAIFPVATNHSKGCGGVMRVAPCGLVGWRSHPGDRSMAFPTGCFAAALTHGHPTGYLAAGTFAHLIHLLLRATPVERAVDDAIAELEGREDSHETAQALRMAQSLAAHDGPRDPSRLGAGWVAEEALAIAVYCALSHSRDFEAAVRLAANHSGDSDSTAAITGNLLGTHLGLQAIPPAWLSTLELKDTIMRLAVALHNRFVLHWDDPGWAAWHWNDDHVSTDTRPPETVPLTSPTSVGLYVDPSAPRHHPSLVEDLFSSRRKQAFIPSRTSAPPCSLGSSIESRCSHDA